MPQRKGVNPVRKNMSLIISVRESNFSSILGFQQLVIFKNHPRYFILTLLATKRRSRTLRL